MVLGYRENSSIKNHAGLQQTRHFLTETLILEGSDEFSPGTNSPVPFIHRQDFVQQSKRVLTPLKISVAHYK